MSQTKEELMTEILQMDLDIENDTSTKEFLLSLDPVLVKGFEVKEGEALTLIVKLNDNQKFTYTYTDLTVFVNLLQNMVIEVGNNLVNREVEKTNKEAELKTLLPSDHEVEEANEETELKTLLP